MDVPSDRFLVAGKAWQAIRSGDADPDVPFDAARKLFAESEEQRTPRAVVSPTTTVTPAGPPRQHRRQTP